MEHDDSRLETSTADDGAVAGAQRTMLRAKQPIAAGTCIAMVPPLCGVVCTPHRRDAVFAVARYVLEARDVTRFLSVCRGTVTIRGFMLRDVARLRRDAGDAVSAVDVMRLYAAVWCNLKPTRWSGDGIPIDRQDAARGYVPGAWGVYNSPVTCINHSCRANASLIPIEDEQLAVYYDTEPLAEMRESAGLPQVEVPTMALVTTADVGAGEEITLNYLEHGAEATGDRGHGATLRYVLGVPCTCAACAAAALAAEELGASTAASSSSSSSSSSSASETESQPPRHRARSSARKRHKRRAAEATRRRAREEDMRRAQREGAPQEESAAPTPRASYRDVLVAKGAL